MENWESAEKVQKNESGEYRAMIGGEWIPVEKAQKNEKGQYRIMRFEQPTEQHKELGFMDAISMLSKSSPVLERNLSAPLEAIDTIRNPKTPAQYAGAAIESGLSPPALMAGAGAALSGPVGMLGGLAIGTVGEIPAMITGNENLSPSAFITRKLRESGITPDPDPENKFGRKVAGYIGAGSPMAAASKAPMQALTQAAMAGVGGATGAEISDDNPYVELGAAMLPGAAYAAGKGIIKYASPTEQLRRKIAVDEALKQHGTRENIAKGKALQDEFGGQLSAAEKGLGESARAAENEIAGYRPLQEAVRKQNNFDKLITSIKGMVGTTTSEEAAKQLSGKTRAKIESLKSSRVPEFDDALERASSLEAGKPSIDVTSVKKGIIEEIRNISKSKPIGLDDQATIKYLMSKLKGLSDNKVNVRGAQSILHDYTIEAKATGGELTDIGKAAQRRGANIMKSLMNEAVDTSAQNGNKAAGILSEARSKYADVMSNLAEIGSTPLGSVIERSTKKGGPVTVRDIQSAYKKSTPEHREIYQRLLGGEKEITKAFRGAWLDDLIEKSTVPASGEIGRTDVVLSKFLKEWKVDKNFTDTFPDPKEAAKLLRAREYLSRIVERGTQKASQGIIGQVGSEAMGATGMLSKPTGQTPIFIMGGITKRIFPKFYHKILTTDEGLDALMKVSKPEKYSTAEVAAAASMIQAVTNEK